MLERYFQQEHYYGDSYPTRMFGRLLAATFSSAGNIAALNKALDGANEPIEDWTRDPWCYEQAATEVISTLARCRPPGAVKQPIRRSPEQRRPENILGKLHTYFTTRRDEPSGEALPAPLAAVGLVAEQVAAKIGAYTEIDERARRLRAEAARLAKDIDAYRQSTGKEIEGLDDLFGQIREQVATIDVPSVLLTGAAEHYALDVVGNGMVEAGIFDGDTVVIERCDDAKDGEIVVAMVDGGEVMLRRLRRQGDSITLEPANKSYEALTFELGGVEINGRLVGLMRQYPSRPADPGIGEAVRRFTAVPTKERNKRAERARRK